MSDVDVVDYVPVLAGLIRLGQLPSHLIKEVQSTPLVTVILVSPSPNDGTDPLSNAIFYRPPQDHPDGAVPTGKWCAVQIKGFWEDIRTRNYSQLQHTIHHIHDDGDSVESFNVLQYMACHINACWAHPTSMRWINDGHLSGATCDVILGLVMNVDKRQANNPTTILLPTNQHGTAWATLVVNIWDTTRYITPDCGWLCLFVIYANDNYLYSVPICDLSKYNNTNNNNNNLFKQNTFLHQNTTKIQRSYDIDANLPLLEAMFVKKIIYKWHYETKMKNISFHMFEKNQINLYSYIAEWNDLHQQHNQASNAEFRVKFFNMLNMYKDLLKKQHLLNIQQYVQKITHSFQNPSRVLDNAVDGNNNIAELQNEDNNDKKTQNNTNQENKQPINDNSTSLIVDKQHNKNDNNDDIELVQTLLNQLLQYDVYKEEYEELKHTNKDKQYQELIFGDELDSNNNNNNNSNTHSNRHQSSNINDNNNTTTTNNNKNKKISDVDEPHQQMSFSNNLYNMVEMNDTGLQDLLFTQEYADYIIDNLQNYQQQLEVMNHNITHQNSYYYSYYHNSTSSLQRQRQQQFEQQQQPQDDTLLLTTSDTPHTSTTSTSSPFSLSHLFSSQYGFVEPTSSSSSSSNRINPPPTIFQQRRYIAQGTAPPCRDGAHALLTLCKQQLMKTQNLNLEKKLDDIRHLVSNNNGDNNINPKASKFDPNQADYPEDEIDSFINDTTLGGDSEEGYSNINFTSSSNNNSNNNVLKNTAHATGIFHVDHNIYIQSPIAQALGGEWDVVMNNNNNSNNSNSNDTKTHKQQQGDIYETCDGDTIKNTTILDNNNNNIKSNNNHYPHHINTNPITTPFSIMLQQYNKQYNELIQYKRQYNILLQQYNKLDVKYNNLLIQKDQLLKIKDYFESLQDKIIHLEQQHEIYITNLQQQYINEIVTLKQTNVEYDYLLKKQINNTTLLKNKISMLQKQQHQHQQPNSSLLSPNYSNQQQKQQQHNLENQISELKEHITVQDIKLRDHEKRDHIQQQQIQQLQQNVNAKDRQIAMLKKMLMEKQ